MRHSPTYVLILLLALAQQSLVVRVYAADCTPLWTTSLTNVQSSAISNDGSYVAVGEYLGSPSFQTKVSLFTRESSTPLWSYTSPGGYFVSMSKDGSYVATGGPTHFIQLFGRNQSNPLWNFTAIPVSETSPIITVAISRDGQYIAAQVSRYGAYVNTVYLFHRSSNVPLWSYNISRTFPESYFAPIRISNDGGYIVTVGTSGSLLLFSRANNQTLWMSSIFGTPLMNGNGDFIVAVSGRNINILSKTSNVTQRTITASTSEGVYGTDFSDDGSTIALGYGFDLFLFDRSSGRQLFNTRPRFNQGAGIVETLSLSADGGKVAVGSGLNALFLYDRSGSQLCAASGGRRAAISGDGRFAVSGDSTLALFEVPSSPISVFAILLITGGLVAVGLTVFFLFWRRRSRRNALTPQGSRIS